MAPPTRSSASLDVEETKSADADDAARTQLASSATAAGVEVLACPQHPQQGRVGLIFRLIFPDIPGNTAA